MLHKIILCLTLTCAALASPKFMGQAALDRPDADQEQADGGALNQLNWLQGDWIGEGFGGQAEEVWLKPAGGAMLGVFRLVVDNKIKFYELVTITEKEGELLMTLKHFHSNLVGWEEKDESLQWPASEVSASSVRFGPVLYELNKNGKLEVWVELGEDKTEHLTFHK